jgi:SAM-dependent methyltransferase
MSIQALCREVFAYPPRVKRVVSSYLLDTEKARLFNKDLPFFNPRDPLPDFINLANPEVLRLYIDPKLQDQSEVCVKIAQSTYEAAFRTLASQEGIAFPMEPETLSYAMQLARGETVVELAGASGENAILLGFAGAKEIYMNELDPKERGRFEALTKLCPRPLQRKIFSVEGDCLDLLKKKSVLISRVGLVLCRNLIHFFKDEQQSRFFEQLKKMLKPGGRAIISVNSQYALPDMAAAFAAHPNETCFYSIQLLVTDDLKGSGPCAILYREYSPCPDTKLGGFETFSLYERGLSTGGKWVVNNDQFQKLDERLRPLIKKAIDENKKLVAPIRSGRIRLLISPQRVYNQEALRALCEKHGFHVELIYDTATNGHLAHGEDTSVLRQQVGAIVRSFS